MPKSELTAPAAKITTPTTEATPPAAKITTPAPATLPAGYLSAGYYATADNGKKYFRKEYLEVYAVEIAAALTAGPSKITAAAFNSAFLRDVKKHLRRGIPYEAKATCAAAMLPQAIKLVAKHKAPPILRDMITAAVGAVNDDASFEALHKHLDAVYSFILDRERGDA